MAKKKDKEKVKEGIKEFFEDTKNKTPREVRKIKKDAMSINYKLGTERKKFCRGCYGIFPTDIKVRIKEGMKVVKCDKCGKVSKWKI